MNIFTSRLIIKGLSHKKYHINPIETFREYMDKGILTMVVCRFFQK